MGSSCSSRARPRGSSTMRSPRSRRVRCWQRASGNVRAGASSAGPRGRTSSARAWRWPRAVSRRWLSGASSSGGATGSAACPRSSISLHERVCSSPRPARSSPLPPSAVARISSSRSWQRARSRSRRSFSVPSSSWNHSSRGDPPPRYWRWCRRRRSSSSPPWSTSWSAASRTTRDGR